MNVQYGNIESDLALETPFAKGCTEKIKNCWHFSTDGNFAEYFFLDEDDFIHGMNRIYFVLRKFAVTILAFCLMDNHVHFVLWGEFGECRSFMHEYVRRTSIHIARRHGERHKLEGVPVNFQAVTDDDYLKTVIAYVLKNPPVAGIPFNAYDYPWSSASLYMRAHSLSTGKSNDAVMSRTSLWASPARLSPDYVFDRFSDRNFTEMREETGCREHLPNELKMIGRMIFPGEYVAAGIVDRIYRTFKSFNYFMCRSREADVESRGGSLSRLSIPYQELRQHKGEICRELFGEASSRFLSTEQRFHLAKALRARFNCSPKQIARVSGLKYEEIKNHL